MVALIALGVLTLIVVTSMQRAQVDTSLAGNMNRANRASGVADTAIALTARKVLDAYTTSHSIDNMFHTVQFGTTGGGEYAVGIYDNDYVGTTQITGENGNDSVDHDLIFRLVSTGALGTTEHIIDAYYQIQPGSGPSAPPDSSGIGAMGLCSNNTDIAKGNTIQGADYNLPAYPCSGAGCNGADSGGPAHAGLSYNGGATADISSGTPGGTPPINNNANIDCTSWETFATNAGNIAQTTYAASSGPFNSDANAFGTSASPKIVLIQGTAGENVKFNGNLYGNGILIIRNCQAEFTGTLTYAGLILIQDEGGGIKIGGTPQVFGSTMVLGSTVADNPVEIDVNNNNARFRYSTQGLAKAAQAFTNAGGGGASSLQVVAWRTIGAGSAP
ncbi:MAG TPA: hypothetical protein VI895_09980 [Bdellovibrionota bacterium]|nr:hypothetical protein [Bdellovibrionota bacterium]